MNRKTALVTMGVVASVAAAAVVASVAVPASAASSNKAVLQHFDAKSSSKPLEVTKTGVVLTDSDVAGGKVIGRDVLYCTHASTASHCSVAFGQKGGLLYARFTLSDKTGELKGTVAGGTGAFAHAKGTLAGKAVSQTDVKITLHYTK